MKTYTKYALILLSTLSVSGCFSEDDKSYVEVGKVAENTLQEELPRTLVQCYLYENNGQPSHEYRSTRNASRMVSNGDQIVLSDGTRLPTAQCIMTPIK